MDVREYARSPWKRSKDEARWSLEGGCSCCHAQIACGLHSSKTEQFAKYQGVDALTCSDHRSFQLTVVSVQSLLNSRGVFEKDLLSCNNKMEIHFRGEKRADVLICRTHSRDSWILLLWAFRSLRLFPMYCLAQLPPARAKLLKKYKPDPEDCKIWFPNMHIKWK